MRDGSAVAGLREAYGRDSLTSTDGGRDAGIGGRVDVQVRYQNAVETRQRIVSSLPFSPAAFKDFRCSQRADMARCSVLSLPTLLEHGGGVTTRRYQSSQWHHSRQDMERLSIQPLDRNMI